MDPVVELRRAALRHLAADGTVTAVIPVAQHYPEAAPANPTKPFLKSGTPIAGPLTGHRRRRTVRFPIYVRADARRSANGAMIETSADHMGRCVSAIVNSLYRARVPIPGGTAKLTLVNDIRRNVDGETDAMEANIEFSARVMAG